DRMVEEHIRRARRAGSSHGAGQRLRSHYGLEVLGLKELVQQVGDREQHQAAEVVVAAGALESLRQLAERDRRPQPGGLDDIAAAIPEVLPGVVGLGVLLRELSDLGLTLRAVSGVE